MNIIQESSLLELLEEFGPDRADIPEWFTPQLPSFTPKPPIRGNWIHEMKYDGYRLIARMVEGEVRFFARHGIEWTSKCHSLVPCFERLRVDQAIIDGELVALRHDGVVSFTSLQHRLSGMGDAELRYFAFDLLYLDGFDLRHLPLLERKKFLRLLLGRLNDEHAQVRFSEHVIGKGDAVYTQACNSFWEGVVSKRYDLPYQSGRSSQWLKCKCLHTEEFIILGYNGATDVHAPRTLLLGAHDEAGRLMYCGQVRSGVVEQGLNFYTRLESMKKVAAPVFYNLRAPLPEDVIWIQPQLVGQIEFEKFAPSGVVRHPYFVGLRDDKRADEVALPDQGAPSADR